MSRLFPSGSRVVASSGGTELAGLRTLAATRGEGSARQLSVMVVNDAHAARTVKILVPGGGRKALEIYRYFDGDRTVDDKGYPAGARKMAATDLAKGVTVELPSRGVVFVETK